MPDPEKIRAAGLVLRRTKGGRMKTNISAIDKSGIEHRVEADNNMSLMEILRPLDIGIEGECEGSLACATCHVWVDEAWMPRLEAISDAEEDMLDSAFLVRPNSRLCCQIKVASQLEGLKVTVPS